jgi:UDPglucose--hexose-1-phosphate uridylyltransferase
MESILKAFEIMGKNHRCRICDSQHSSRVVHESEHWVFFASGSPIRNYHIRFAPKRHVERITDLNLDEIADMCTGLQKISQALDDMKVTEDRNLVINTLPFGYKSFFHLFGEILPYELIGGAEMADDMRVVRMSPTKFAADMRKIINELVP